MVALLLLTGPQAGFRYETQGEVIIGRGSSCAISIEDAKVSRRHVRLILQDEQARVRDLGSRNGTLINGEKLEGEAILLPGDRLQVGDSTVLCEPSSRIVLSDEEDLGELYSSPAEALVSRKGGFRACVELVSATSEAMVLQRAANELARALGAPKAAVLLGGEQSQVMAAAVAGAQSVTVSRALFTGVLQRQEVIRARGVLCGPLIASATCLGLLWAERPEPFGEEDLRHIAELGRLAGEAVVSKRSRPEHKAQLGALIGSSRPFRKTVEAIRRAALGRGSIVLFGEQGSGRAQAARYIHERARPGGPLVEVDCRLAAPEVEMLLFGGGGGPGAPPPCPSALRRAEGGSLLLLNIESLPAHLRSSLAGLLSQQPPSDQARREPPDVRILLTAPSSLKQMETRGQIDAQLALALAGRELEIPPLRGRKSDVMQLFDWFCSELKRTRRREPPILSPDAKRLMVEHPWPGNVEELRLVAERLSLIHSGGEVTALHLDRQIQDGHADAGPHSLAERVARLERDAISEALRQAKGKKIRAAAALGISRPTLDKKILEFNLTVEKERS